MAARRASMRPLTKGTLPASTLGWAADATHVTHEPGGRGFWLRYSRVKPCTKSSTSSITVACRLPAGVINTLPVCQVEAVIHESRRFRRVDGLAVDHGSDV